MNITLDTIKERLEIDRKKPSRLPTWEEIEYLLNLVDLLTPPLVEEPGQLLGYADDGSEVRTVEKPPLGPRPDFGPHPLAQCSHCQDDPPDKQTCPVCGRTKG